MKPFIIAELGQAHDGSLGIAHSYIDALAKTGVDAIKFQTHIAHAESSLAEPFRVNFSYEDATRYSYWKRMEFTFEQWKGLKQHCDDVGVEFISSPFCNEAVDLLEKLDVKRYKIGSGEVNNLLLLEKIARTGKPVMVSSGMSSFEEIEKSIEFLQDRKCDVSIFQCTTSYPTHAEQWGLNVIQELKNKFDVPVGFSDHSGDIFACLAATSLGADMLEFHAVFDKRMFGPDAKSSLEIDHITKMVQGIRQISQSLNHPINKHNNSEFSDLKQIFEKSLSVNKDLTAGHIIAFDDLEAKKPKGHGIDALRYREIIGLKTNRTLSKWDFLNTTDLEK